MRTTKKSEVQKKSPAQEAGRKHWWQIKRETRQNSRKLTGRDIFNQIILVFTIGCIFGTYYEEIMCMVRSLIETGSIEWVSRRGMLYGPFSPVYGVGGVLMYLAFYLPRANTAICFFGGAILGGIVEVLLSLLQEVVFGTVSWDYRGQPLSIFGGRTTVLYMLVWGLIITVFARWIFPQLEKLYFKVRPRTLNIVCVVLTVILVADGMISTVATLRQAARRSGDQADNAIEVMLDTVYNDERMKRTYSNARIRE